MSFFVNSSFALKAFINRSILEVSLLNETDKAALDYACKELETEYVIGALIISFPAIDEITIILVLLFLKTSKK